MIEFIKRYFIEPIYTSEGYNIYNTAVYGALLLAGAYGIAKLLKRFEVKMDERLFMAALPFVVLGGFLRALEEFARITGAGLLPLSALFLTPGIYLLVAVLAIASLTVSVYLRRANYASAMAQMGWLLVLVTLPLLLYDVLLVSSGSVSGIVFQPFVFFLILLLTALVALAGIAVLKRVHLMRRENAIIFAGFAFEVSAVVLATYFLSYTAAQPETRALLGHNPFLYPFFKLGLILGIIYLVEGVPREEEAHWLSKLILLVLGLPMGIHNSLQVLMGV